MEVNNKDILNSMFNPTETVCFRILDDKKESSFTGKNLECTCIKYGEMEDTLKRHNSLSRGIFFVINFGGHDDAAISRINAQFVEMDHGSFVEQQKKVDAFPLPPSMIVQTQKSLHVYWFMDGNAEVERFRTIQKQLVKHFDGDPACVNESRVMRLPGFDHCKKDPVKVVCKSFHPERKYSQDQLAEVLPDIEMKPVERRHGSEKGLDAVMNSCLFIQHCQKNAETLPEPQWHAMITNLVPFDDGANLIHTLSAPYPGYNENNTQRKINRCLENGTKPYTCQTICDRGFKCPKFLAGGCGVKAPAALCYKPLNLDVLQNILDNIPVTEEIAEDLMAAKKYIVDCLFNQDAVSADIIINTKMREHFGFKPSQLKSLNMIFKEVNKAYKGSKSAQRAKLNEELPAWYEPTEKGCRVLTGILAKHLLETEQAFFVNGQYYQYQNGVYKEMDVLKAQNIVQKKLLPKETTMAHIFDAEKQWRLLIQKDIRELNANPYLINIQNGLYDVLEDKLIPHDPKYCSTVQLNVSYDKNAKCPLFFRFLEESMGGDMGQVDLIQEMLGYFLIPVTLAQKCFVIVGVAGAGKSVLLRVLNDILLGKENVSNVSWQALNERFKTAELFGKLANIFADLPTKNIDDNGIFKAIVGEDYLTVERKNQNPFSFQSTARLLFSCNSIPKNYGDRSEGFYRRLIIIRFNHVVAPEKRDPDLIEKFREEADGIFLFALEGLRRLIKNRFKFNETEVNKDELQKYREESDSVLSFVKENCALDALSVASSTEVFDSYIAYCDECGLKPCSQKKMVQTITTAYSSVVRGRDSISGRHTLEGIRLLQD